MLLVETDAVNGTELFHLTLSDSNSPQDNIYGEQPYSSPCGTRIAVRRYPKGSLDGGLSILDLSDGSLHPVINTTPRFPAFHAWGQYLFCQEQVGSDLVLRRHGYTDLKAEDVLVLPSDGSEFSYGTVSPDLRYYAVSAHRDKTSSQLRLFDLQNGSEKLLAESDGQWFKHEQFSQDGTNRILIQANSADVTVVNLGVVGVDDDAIRWLPVDARPLVPLGIWSGKERYTPRCTGHETWIGETDRVFLSTAYDAEKATNIWDAALSDSAPRVTLESEHHFGHVSASRCGSFWLADAPDENGIPIYVGSFQRPSCARLCFSRTVHDGEQWSHTHPYFTADNRWVIFTSNRSGLPQVYGARIAEGFLACL